MQLPPDVFIAASLNTLRLDILREESDAEKRGAVQLNKMSPGTFLRHALDIEERQYVSKLSLIIPILTDFKGAF